MKKDLRDGDQMDRTGLENWSALGYCGMAAAGIKRVFLEQRIFARFLYFYAVLGMADAVKIL